MDFDEDGKWDEGQQEGPVIHIPNDIKDIAVKHYRVEWLDVTEGEGSYSKNHMVATLIFTEAVTINGVKYKAARLSMELGSWKEVTSIIGQTGQEVRIQISTLLSDLSRALFGFPLPEMESR